MAHLCGPIITSIFDEWRQFLANISFWWVMSISGEWRQFPTNWSLFFLFQLSSLRCYKSRSDTSDGNIKIQRSAYFSATNLFSNNKLQSTVPAVGKRWRQQISTTNFWTNLSKFNKMIKKTSFIASSPVTGALVSVFSSLFFYSFFGIGFLSIFLSWFLVRFSWLFLWDYWFQFLRNLVGVHF